MKMKRWKANAIMIGAMVVVAAGGVFAMTRINKQENQTSDQQVGTGQTAAAPMASGKPGTSPLPGSSAAPFGSPVPLATVIPGASVLPSSSPTVTAPGVTYLPAGSGVEINTDWIYLETVAPSSGNGPTATKAPTATKNPTNLATRRPVSQVTPTPVPEAKTACTIRIGCETILNHMDQLKAGKESFVPADGCILPATTVEFSEGETVFDVLKRVCTNGGIHLESAYTPMYDSYYIEGIHQLYERDCGSHSGWMYKVNGTYPNVGCSQYKLQKGDVIEWSFTCDGGTDIGGRN